MKKPTLKNIGKADCVCLGIILFAVLIGAVFGIVKLCEKIGFDKKYGDITGLAENHGLKIISIEDNGELGAEIYISESAAKPAVMEKYYRFSQALAEYLNSHKDVFDRDGKPVPVKLTFGGVENQSATHDTAVSFKPSDSDSGYEFTDHYILFETDFEQIGYIKNAKRLYLLRGKINDLKGIENFTGIEYLYADIAEDKREELEKKLPNCKIEYRDQGSSVP